MYIYQMNLKENILNLRSSGLSYNKISQILSCSKSTISYYCGQNVKEKSIKRGGRNRKRGLKELKVLHGGACRACKYDKCLEALHFHHIDHSQKTGLVSHIIIEKGIKAALAEAQKCVLLCGNCHCEVHAGKRDISNLLPYQVSVLTKLVAARIELAQLDSKANSLSLDDTTGFKTTLRNLSFKSYLI